MINSDYILEIKNLSKKYYSKYNQVFGIRDLNLKILDGEFVIFIGPSGSGKTTLLNCIAGMIRPSQGEVNIDGLSIKNLNGNQKAEIRKIKIGYIYQFHNLHNGLTAKENVELPMMISKKYNRKERSQRAFELLDLVEMRHRSNNTPMELSGGEQQRISFVRALANDPPILLADEPTGNVDSEMAQELLEILINFNNSKGKTILMVTHDLDMIKAGMRVVEMRDGSIFNDFLATESNIANLKREAENWQLEILEMNEDFQNT